MHSNLGGHAFLPLIFQFFAGLFFRRIPDALSRAFPAPFHTIIQVSVCQAQRQIVVLAMVVTWTKRCQSRLCAINLSQKP